MDALNVILLQLGIGGIGGFLVGYAVKKVAKILAVILGLGFLSLLYLSYKGIIQISYDRLLGEVESGLKFIGIGQSVISSIIANIPFAASFITGFILGLKKG
ncbi:MAG: FUN14 domain-containing protein [Candidatus Methanomethylicia archaeon]